ncbi:1-aminocyclopropane-1-carboxylate deaminase/D-cysteine desulfhydrase [Nocardia sp. NPDC004151]|uniref:1-aminocyclopropane-1-carboxylate deaminase/D-cysteine desulfhydrase n=1 Tax=Nocardia sp. NPDC004151 TaxID=3364304 RepID=UPI003681F412
MSVPLLHQYYPPLSDALPHLALGTAPTPLRQLPLLPASDTEIWIKDEGVFGDGGWGGNKVRKLEWLLPDALRRGRRTILTVGGLGTNWGLATALYAGAHGLATALALVDQPMDEHVRAQLERIRNSGATVHFTHTVARTALSLPWLLARHSSGTTPPYFLPAGGSSRVGLLGYVEVALELAAQVADGTMPEPSHIVTAVGSGGTAAGLALGLAMAGLRTRVVGVVVNDKLRLDEPGLLRLARRTERLLRERGARLPESALTPDRLLLVRDQLGAGYGHATEPGRLAQQLAHDRAGLELEPVYTAKAMAAVLDLDRRGALNHGPIVYLHTDGPR